MAWICHTICSLPTNSFRFVNYFQPLTNCPFRHGCVSSGGWLMCEISKNPTPFRLRANNNNNKRRRKKKPTTKIPNKIANQIWQQKLAAPIGHMLLLCGRTFICALSVLLRNTEIYTAITPIHQNYTNKDYYVVTKMYRKSSSKTWKQQLNLGHITTQCRIVAWRGAGWW